LCREKSKEKKRKVEIKEEDLENIKEQEKLYKLSIEKAKDENKKNGIKGKIRVDKLPHFRSPAGQNKKWPKVDGYKNINVCSSAAGIWKQLSPMIIGKIDISKLIDNNLDKGEEIYGLKLPKAATNIENLWQFSKVWEGEVDDKGFPTREFFERRNGGWKDKKAHRYVKKGRNVPLFSYWNGEHLSYIQARKKIYCPIYAEYVKKTVAWKQLEKLLQDGYNIQILGYDGYDFSSKTLLECINDPSRPFGHELVIASMLLNQSPWNGEVITTEDNSRTEKIDGDLEDDEISDSSEVEKVDVEED